MQSRRTNHRRWNERDLIRRLCHALDIASQAIEHLAAAGYIDTNRPDGSIRPEKVIAETAMLLHGASLAMHHHEVKARIHRVARQLSPHARSPQIRLGLALNSALALDYSLAHIVLTRLGFADPKFDRLLNASLASQAHGGRERVPHRALEQEWIESLRSTSTPANLRRLERAARRTILGKPMDLFSSTDEDLYAFTHAVMYATGMQLRPAAMPRSRVAILAEAEVALARSLDAQDYDLAGEILLTWPLVGNSWSPVAAFAFHVIAEVEDKAGFLPTPATRLSELNALEGEERSRYLLATAYHTAYVMGLVCAAALQPECAPPAEPARHSPVKGCARQILPFLDDGDAAPHWRAAFDRLDEHQADSLGCFVFNLVLLRKAEAKDFNGLAQSLRLGYKLGLATTPAASQAAELLERVAICAQGIGAPPPNPTVSVPIAEAQQSRRSNLVTLERELPFGFTLISGQRQLELVAG